MCSVWENLFPLANVHKLIRIVSNHNSLIQDTLVDKEPTHKSFRFESTWIQKDAFISKVEKNLEWAYHC